MVLLLISANCRFRAGLSTLVRPFYMSLSDVLVRSITHRSRQMYFPKAFPSQASRFHWSSPTLSLLKDGHSQQDSKQCWGTKGESLVLCLVFRTLYFGALKLIYWRYSWTRNGRRWRICDLHKRVTLAELAPGRLNEFSQFKSNTNWKVYIIFWKFKFKWIKRIKSNLSKFTKYCNKV